MTTTTRTDMHPSQQRYALALALYETALAAANREAPEAPQGAPVDVQRAADDAYAAARERHSVDALREAVTTAADAMVRDRSEALARTFPDRAEEIREAVRVSRERGGYRVGAMLVDLCFRAA